MSDRNDAPEPADEPTPRVAALNEDWLAAVVGLAILALALLGLIPDALVW